MTERQLLTDFTKIIKNVPGLFWYKIPDTYGGMKKPFDVFAIYKGRPICIEFKKGTHDLEAHQIKNLDKVKKAGGVALEASFYTTNENPRTMRNIYIYPFPYKENPLKQHIIQYKEQGSKEPYPRVQEFLEWAISL